MSAGKKRAGLLSWFLTLCVMACMFLLDQGCKYLAISKLRGKPPVRIISGILELDYVENTGMAFGLMTGRPFFLAAVSVVFIVAGLFILNRFLADRRMWPAAVCLTVILAGAAGNMYDRIFRGMVIDYISFVLIRFPVFNLADCFVVVGTLMLCVLLLFYFSEEDLAGWKRN